MIYTPVGDYLLIEPVENEKKLASGIIIPDTAAEAARPREGYIRAVGNGVESPELKVLGTKVLYKIWGGNVFKDNENRKEYLMVLEEDILAIIDEEEATS